MEGYFLGVARADCRINQIHHQCSTQTSGLTFTCKALIRSSLCLLTISILGIYPNFSLGKSGNIQISPLSQHITQPFISHIYRDSFGFMWIGTQHGLYEFSGSEYRKYGPFQKSHRYIPSSDVRGIAEDSKQRLLVATFGGGLLRLNRSTSEFESIENNNESAELNLTGLHQLGPNEMIFESKQLLHLASPDTSKIGRKVKSSLDRYDIKEIVETVYTPDRMLLVATKKGVFVFDESGTNTSHISLEKALGTASISCIAIVAESKAYIGTNVGKVFLFDLLTSTIEKTADLSSPEISEVTDLAIASGRIWISTNGGLISTNRSLQDKIHLTTENSGLSHNHINSLYENGEILFIGTVIGIDQINPTSILNFNRMNSGIHDDVFAFSRDKYDQLWVGTYNGLYYFDETKERHINYRFSEGSKLPEEKITALASTSKNLWIGLKNLGLHRLDVNTGRLKDYSDTDDSTFSVTKILPSRNGPVYVSSYNKGLYEISRDSLVKIPSDTEESFILLHETKDGTILAASEKRLYKLDTSERHFEPIGLSFPDSEEKPPLLLSIFDLPNGDILMGAKDRGIFLWKSENQDQKVSFVDNFSPDSRINSASVYSILSDNHGNYWCSTSNGILVINSDGELMLSLTSLDGLQADDFNFGAHYKDEKGHLYFGGVNGYNILDPDNIKTSRPHPPLVITEVIVDGLESLSFRELLEIKELLIPYKSNQIQIIYSLLDFLNPTRNHYSHFLEQLDTNWTDNGTNNKATYTNLPPGNYTFRAKGANAAGVWSEDAATLRIRVLPPWYMTQWAYAMYALLVLLFVWGAMRVYRTQLLKQEAERRADEMHEIADMVRDELQESHELHDDLVNAAYQHNLDTISLLRDALSAPERPLDRQQQLLGHLAAMEALEKCYYFQEGALAANLNDYLNRLSDQLLPGCTVNPSTVTTINLSTETLVPATVAGPIAIILYELLENALKHAFPVDSPANFVQIKVDFCASTSTAPDILEVSVQDDGVGLPEHVTPDNAASPGYRVINTLRDKLSAEMSIDRGSCTLIKLRVPLPEPLA